MGSVMLACNASDGLLTLKGVFMCIYRRIYSSAVFEGLIPNPVRRVVPFTLTKKYCSIYNVQLNE